MDECFDFDTPITQPTHLEAEWNCKPEGVVVLTHTGGSGQATFRNKWTSPVLINGTSVASKGTLTLNFEEGDNATVVYTAEDETAFEGWVASNGTLPLCSTPSLGGLTFELTYVDVDTMLNEDGELGDYAFANFISQEKTYWNLYGHSAIASINPNAFDFSHVKKLGSYCFFGFMDSQERLTEVPSNLFYFPALIEAGLYCFGYCCAYSQSLKTVKEGNFIFPNLKSVGTNFFTYGFYQINTAGGVDKIEKNCLQFPNLQTAGDSCFYGMFLWSTELTELPAGSFNWGNNLTTVGSTNFLAYFAANSGLTVPGNRMVQIYTPVAVTRFDGSTTGGKGNYTGGQTIYINGTIPVTTISEFKETLDSGEANGKFPVGTEIEDEYDGADNPLIVVQYLDSSNNSSYGGAEGAILMRKYVVVLDDLRFSTSTSCNYPESLVYSQLTGSSYLNKCSAEIMNSVSELAVPYDTPTVGIGTLQCTWFLPSGIETGGTKNTGEGVYWDYYRKDGPATATNSAVLSRVATSADGTKFNTWLRSTWASGDPGTPMAIFTTGVENGYGGTNSYYIRPACFIAKSTTSSTNLEEGEKE